MAPSKRRQVSDDDCEKEDARGMDVIYREAHFNFIKIFLLSYFSDHIP